MAPDAKPSEHALRDVMERDGACDHHTRDPEFATRRILFQVLVVMIDMTQFVDVAWVLGCRLLAVWGTSDASRHSVINSKQTIDTITPLVALRSKLMSQFESVRKSDPRRPPSPVLPTPAISVMMVTARNDSTGCPVAFRSRGLLFINDSSSSNYAWFEERRIGLIIKPHRTRCGTNYCP